MNVCMYACMHVLSCTRPYGSATVLYRNIFLFLNILQQNRTLIFHSTAGGPTTSDELERGGEDRRVLDSNHQPLTYVTTYIPYRHTLISSPSTSKIKNSCYIVYIKQAIYDGIYSCSRGKKLFSAMVDGYFPPSVTIHTLT